LGTPRNIVLDGEIAISLSFIEALNQREKSRSLTCDAVTEELAAAADDDDDVSYACIQVSLDAQVRETINRKMVNPSSHTFDEAQIQIYTLMQRDSYPRFLNSQIYKRLLQTTSSSAPMTPGTEPPPPQQQDSGSSS